MGVSHLQGEEKSQALPGLGHRGELKTCLPKGSERGQKAAVQRQHWPWHLHSGITGWAWAGDGLRAGRDGLSPPRVGLWHRSGSVKDQRGGA